MNVVKPAIGMLATITGVTPAVAVPLLLADAPAASALTCPTIGVDCTFPDLPVKINNVWKTCANDGRTIAVSSNSWVELRYSDACRTIWGRAYGNVPDGDMHAATFKDTGLGLPSMWGETSGHGLARGDGKAWTLQLNDAGMFGQAVIFERDIFGDWFCAVETPNPWNRSILRCM